MFGGKPRDGKGKRGQTQIACEPNIDGQTAGKGKLQPPKEKRGGRARGGSMARGKKPRNDAAWKAREGKKEGADHAKLQKGTEWGKCRHRAKITRKTDGHEEKERRKTIF